MHAWWGRLTVTSPHSCSGCGVGTSLGPKPVHSGDQRGRPHTSPAHVLGTWCRNSHGFHGPFESRLRMDPCLHSLAVVGPERSRLAGPVWGPL